MNNSRISIALATYNGGLFLEEQLNSILNQSISPYEIVISDDQSTDDTIEVISKFISKHSSIKLLQPTEKLGVVKNFENAFRNCTGDYIAFSDQDDVWLPNKLKKSYGLMQNLEIKFGIQTPCLVFSDLQVVDDSLSQIAPSYIQSKKLIPQNTGLSNLLVENVSTGCTILLNRPLANLVPIFPTKAVMHDVFVTMVASSFGKISFVNEPTVLYRQHQNNVVGLSKNGFQKIVHNTFGVLFNREHGEKFLANEILQAQAFYDMYHHNLPKRVNEMLLGFISLKRKRKISKVYFLIKNNILKGSLLRNFNLLLKV